MKTPPEPTTEIPRHSLAVRLIHWLIALCFIHAMATGLTLYWDSILRWMLPYFGGEQNTIALHFVAGLALAVFAVPMYFLWRKRMRWTATDSYFIRHLPQHGLRPDQSPPPDTGFFNGGQKLYFWAFILSTVYLLITGLVWWWRREPWMPKEVYVVSRTSHRVVSVIMSGALLIHIYKATVGEPGTFASMVKGTVTSSWARLRRPGWFRELGDK
ncbi:MAG: Formate dehydrogenase subunit gamma [Lacunisphaera sp.]|nr:Formate dehydrogenase subunit gamma [Lacunisphaera sp.]